MLLEFLDIAAATSDHMTGEHETQIIYLLLPPRPSDPPCTFWKVFVEASQRANLLLNCKDISFLGWTGKGLIAA